MELQNPNMENLTIVLNELSNMLGVVNQSIMDPEDYDLAKYEDIKFMYDMVKRKGKLSASEAQAFIDELRTVRKL